MFSTSWSNVRMRVIPHRERYYNTHTFPIFFCIVCFHSPTSILKLVTECPGLLSFERICFLFLILVNIPKFMFFISYASTNTSKSFNFIPVYLIFHVPSVEVKARFKVDYPRFCRLNFKLHSSLHYTGSVR